MRLRNKFMGKNEKWLLISVLTDIQSLEGFSEVLFLGKKCKFFSNPKAVSQHLSIPQDPFKPLQSDKGIPQCNWQDSIYQLRENTNGTRNRTERVKTNKAAISTSSFSAFAEKSFERTSANTSRIVQMKLLHAVTHHYLHKEEYSKREQ